jgi:hypothetical protein
LRWMREYMSLAGGYRMGGYGVTIPYFPDDMDLSSAWQTAVPSAPLLGLLNGRYVVAEFPVDAPGLIPRGRACGSYLYENEHVLPRAFTMTRVEPVPSWQEAQRRLVDGFDPSHGALVEEGVALGGPPGLQPAEIVRLTPNQLVVRATVSTPALLVLSEVWYPGWRAIVDGTRQPTYRVDGVVRGVYLEPGSHTVEWQYRPASLQWGGALTLATLLGLIAVELVVRNRSRGAGTRPRPANISVAREHIGDLAPSEDR